MGHWSSPIEGLRIVLLIFLRRSQLDFCPTHINLFRVTNLLATRTCEFSAYYGTIRILKCFPKGIVVFCIFVQSVDNYNTTTRTTGSKYQVTNWRWFCRKSVLVLKNELRFRQSWKQFLLFNLRLVSENSWPKTSPSEFKRASRQLGPQVAKQHLSSVSCWGFHLFDSRIHHLPHLSSPLTVHRQRLGKNNVFQAGFFGLWLNYLA